MQQQNGPHEMYIIYSRHYTGALYRIGLDWMEKEEEEEKKEKFLWQFDDGDHIQSSRHRQKGRL